MSVVTFYGSNKIETAQTASMAGIATHLSIEKNYNTLLLNTKYNDTSLQECFWDQSMSIKPKSDLETGIGGLIKAIASNKTSPEIITNYTRTILKGRLEILKIHSQNKKFEKDIDLKEIAGDTAGFTGAELANVLNEAAIIAARSHRKKISKNDIEEAVKKVTVGLEKHSRVISEKDKKLTAYHEAGHAIVSKFLPTQQDVKEVSIIPRGVAGGYTMYKTNEDKYYISKTEMEEKLIALLGGRAAEKLALDDISTGASNDIEVATQIARDMVTVYGMSDKIGPISLKTDEPYGMQPFGDHIGDNIGEEVKKLIDTAYYQAQQILSQHMDKLDAVANALLEKEIISAEEFQRFFE